jgi:hypothetical protein
MSDMPAGEQLTKPRLQLIIKQVTSQGSISINLFIIFVFNFEKFASPKITQNKAHVQLQLHKLQGSSTIQTS